jgi:hypothetical protein
MIRIEQQRNQVKRSVEFQKNAEIVGIRLTKAEVKGSCEPGPGDDAVLWTAVKFHPSRWGQRENLVTFAVEFDFAISTVEGEPGDVATIQCEFEADYRLSESFVPSESQLTAFHSANAIFNCWPYLREFLQSTTTRMGLPAATVPFLRLVPANAKADQDESIAD